MMYTTPSRRTTLHFAQTFLTDDLTFTFVSYPWRRTMRPRVPS